MAKVFTKRREEGAPMAVEILNTKAMTSLPKPKPETPMKQQADNSSDNVQTSRPRHIIKAPVKY